MLKQLKNWYNCLDIKDNYRSNRISIEEANIRINYRILLIFGHITTIAALTLLTIN